MNEITLVAELSSAVRSFNKAKKRLQAYLETFDVQGESIAYDFLFALYQRQGLIGKEQALAEAILTEVSYLEVDAYSCKQFTQWLNNQKRKLSVAYCDFEKEMKNK